jgi:sulfoxide reductase heme-binding subunit YedZ
MKLTVKWIKQNWLWLVVNLLAILSLISIFSMFNVEFNGLALPTISLNEMAPPPDRPDFDGYELSALGLLIHTTGESAIRWLVLSLSCTPLFILFGWRKMLTIKKATGLYAFLFAVLHTLFFVADEGWLAVFDEFNFVMGLLSVLVMLPLALTSTDGFMKRLGKGWKLLHRGAYAAGVFAVLHLAFLGEGSALLYTAILLIGFAVRVPHLRRAITGFRHHRQKRRLTAAQGV